jgi:RimJ/RimL family protein N-acetyltransferase
MNSISAEVPVFRLPEELESGGLRLRREEPTDEPFLEQLYIDVRWEELARAPWPEETRVAFLRDQFRLQRLHYSRYYSDAEFGILMVNGETAGRLYLHHSSGEIRIVDISLLSRFRGKGIGTGVLQAVLSLARETSKKVSIHVEQFNPAQRLYRRLGFREAGASGPYWLMEWEAGACPRS